MQGCKICDNRKNLPLLPLHSILPCRSIPNIAGGNQNPKYLKNCRSGSMVDSMCGPGSQSTAFCRQDRNLPKVGTRMLRRLTIALLLLRYHSNDNAEIAHFPQGSLMHTWLMKSRHPPASKTTAEPFGVRGRIKSKGSLELLDRKRAASLFRSLCARMAQK